MKTIVLSKGFTSTIDDEDFGRVSKFKWTYKGGYAMRSYGPKNDRKYMYLHRFLLNALDLDAHVDHINGNRLDNRRSNLRIASLKENLRNRNHSVIAKSGLRGVYYSKEYSKRNKPWYSRIRLDSGKDRHLGYFETAEEAGKVFDKAAKEIYGEFCGKLNFT